MANLYQTYEEYRPKLSEKELEDLQTAKELEEKLRADESIGHWEHGWIDNDGNRRPYPVREQEIKIGMERAGAQLSPWEQAGIIYPDDPKTVEKFPGMDPQGNFCEVDMSFAERYAKLKAALSSRTLPVQSYVGIQLRALENEGSPMAGYWSRMKEDCGKIRTYQRAAKLAPTEESSLMLQEDVKALARDSADIKRVNGFLNVMEYLSGLSERKPTGQERDFMKEIGAELEPYMEEKRDNAIMAPFKVNVEFANLDNQVQQKFFSNPLAWNKGPEGMPKDVANEQSVEGMIERYAQATADRSISPLFAQAEKATKNLIRRSELITVDGKMVSDIMKERFQEARKKGTLRQGISQSDWMEENQDRMTNEIVAAGLMAGKRVEAFVPDKNGRISKEPLQITKAGYEPSPLKKVTLNAWERHFAKHGFYKEKAAKAAEYQRVMEARERVLARNEERKLTVGAPTSSVMKEFYFQGWVDEHGPLPDKTIGKLSGTRSAYTTLATCAMLKEGYHIQEILDPGQMKEARDRICKETMDRLVAQDRQWAAEVCYHGHKALNRELDALGHFDITDEKQLFSEQNRPFVFAATVTFDLGQEMNQFEREILALSEKDAPGRGKKAWQEVFEAGDSVATYVDFAKNALKARSNYGDAKEDLVMMARWENLRGMYAERRAANPEAEVTQLGRTVEHYTANLALLSNENFQAFSDRVENDKGFAAGVRKAVYAGKLGNYMKVDGFDPVKNSIHFKIEAKQAEKTGNRRYKIQEAAEKNAAREEAKQEKDAAKEQAKQEKNAVKEEAKQEKKTQKEPLQKQAPKGPARSRR